MHRRPGLIVLLVASLLLAGCLGAVDEASDQGTGLEAASVPSLDAERLSQPVHELDAVVETFLPSHDGTQLHAVEYHPDVAPDETTPVVIHLSPYMGNLDAEAQAQHESYWTQLLVQRGYTVVHASVRGTGYSGGCFQLGGPVEIQDAYELVETYHEAEWSNGNVSLIGVSYPGTTPWQAAIADPPGLKTVVPMEGISDMYRYDHVNGASYTHGPLFPTYYTAIVDWTVVPQNADGAQHVLPPLEFACPGVAERLAAGYETLASGDHDAFWDERDYEAQLDQITVPVFLVGGFQDWNVDPDNGIPVFQELPEGSKAWLGQWAHNVPFANSYNPDWSRHDWNLTLTAWFDEHLKGKDTGIMDEPAVLAQTSRGQWHRTETWPPADTATHRLHLSGDQLTDAPGQQATRSMGPYLPEAAAPAEPATATAAPQELVFTSQALTEDTLIVGQPTLNLTVSVDQPDGHLVARLLDADAEGTNEAPRELGHAILNLAHRESRDAGEPMPTGQATEVQLTFYPLDALVPEGHRLQLVLQPEHEDRIHPSPEQPVITVHMGQGSSSSLALSVLEDPVFEPAPQQGEVAWST